MPASAAWQTAIIVTGWVASIQMPTGTYSSADRLPATADPSAPVNWVPMTRLVRMYPAQPTAARTARPIPT
jgi:hypothetical protein